MIGKAREQFSFLLIGRMFAGTSSYFCVDAQLLQVRQHVAHYAPKHYRPGALPEGLPAASLHLNV
jgi:hypothetical protein